jgi:hypothetical protein
MLNHVVVTNLLDVGIFKYNGGRFASQFERHILEVTLEYRGSVRMFRQLTTGGRFPHLGRVFENSLARGSRARERDLTDIHVQSKRFAHAVRRRTVNSDRSVAFHARTHGRPYPLTIFTTPGGKPAAGTRDAMRSGERGAFSLVLTTSVLPAASDEAIFVMKLKAGAFQGIMPPVTPNGWRIVYPNHPASGL